MRVPGPSICQTRLSRHFTSPGTSVLLAVRGPPSWPKTRKLAPVTTASETLRSEETSELVWSIQAPRMLFRLAIRLAQGKLLVVQTGLLTSDPSSWLPVRSGSVNPEFWSNW